PAGGNRSGAGWRDGAGRRRSPDFHGAPVCRAPVRASCRSSACGGSRSGSSCSAASGSPLARRRLAGRLRRLLARGFGLGGRLAGRLLGGRALAVLLASPLPSTAYAYVWGCCVV